MTTSSSVNFSVNRDEIIKQSMMKIGVLAADETPSSADLNDAALKLNMMIKTLNANGLQEFIQKRATLFLQTSTHQYSLGSTGDHATHSYTRTTISVAEAAGQTVISVTSTTGMTASDYIGIVLDSGAFHWSTISTTGAGTVTINVALPSAAAAGNSVYFYTTKMYRPLRIVYAWLHNQLTNADTPLIIIKNREDYFKIYDKTMDSQPTRIYYDSQLTNGVLYTNYEQINVNETLEMVYYPPVEDFDTATDTPDFPQEHYELLVYGLAIRLAPDYGRTLAERAALIKEASLLGINVKGFYQESPRSVNPTWF